MQPELAVLVVKGEAYFTIANTIMVTSIASNIIITIFIIIVLNMFLGILQSLEAIHAMNVKSLETFVRRTFEIITVYPP
eukprot:756198-Hanusia_phi.AAC.4